MNTTFGYASDHYSRDCVLCKAQTGAKQTNGDPNTYLKKLV